MHKHVTAIAAATLILAAGLVSCGDDPTSSGDTTRPTVVSVSPVDGDLEVSVGSSVSATFSEAMSATSMVDGVLSFNPAVDGSVGYSNRTVTFTPTLGLDTNVTYTATIAASAADVAGNTLASAYTWEFRTYLDVFPPTVVATTPVDLDSSATVNTAVTVTFNEQMDVSTLGAGCFQISPSVDGTFQVTTTGLTFTPDAPLSLYQTYTVTITTAAADLAGNNLESNYSWEFYTSPDTELPTAYLVNPQDGGVLADLTTIEVVASDNDRMGYVEFYVDGAHVSGADDYSFPYEYVWDASAEEIASEHLVYARAFDEAGNSAWSDTAAVSYLWKLGATDFNEPLLPRNLKNVFYRNTGDQIQFRIETWNGWAEYDNADSGIDVAIFIDADQNVGTGDVLTNNNTVPINDIGAEVQMIIGYHGLYMQRWVGGTWGEVEGVEDLVMSRDTNIFEVALTRQRFDDPASFDVVVANVHVTTNEWDWVPDAGHITIEAEPYYDPGPGAYKRSVHTEVPIRRPSTATPFD